MSRDQLQRDGLSGPYELADTSGLDAACEVVLELKALQRQQNTVARLTGLPNEAPNPMIDRHMDIEVLRNLYFDDNLQVALAEHFGNGLFIWRTNFFVKSDGTGQNKWHHDRHFENGNAPLNLFDTSNHYSITIALTDIDLDAGRIEYVKGSHLPIDGFDRDIPRHIEEVPEGRPGSGHRLAAQTGPVRVVSRPVAASQPGVRTWREEDLHGCQGLAGGNADSRLWHTESRWRGAFSGGACRRIPAIRDTASQLEPFIGR